MRACCRDALPFEWVLSLWEKGRDLSIVSDLRLSLASTIPLVTPFTASLVRPSFRRLFGNSITSLLVQQEELSHLEGPFAPPNGTVAMLPPALRESQATRT